MSRNSSHSADFLPSPARAVAGGMTRSDTGRMSKIQITIPLRRLPKGRPNQNFTSSSSNFTSSGFGRKVTCHRHHCKICCYQGVYVPLDSELIRKFENGYSDALTSEELHNYQKRYYLEREHGLHRGPIGKWLKPRLCADAQDAILRSYVRPPPIVIQKYNAHALTVGKPLVPEGWTRHREDREHKARHAKQRRELGLAVPSKPSRQELAATSVFRWSVGYRFNMHASQHVYYRKASVRFPLANHAFGLTANIDLRQFISSMLVSTSLSVGRHFTTTSLVPLVGDFASVIVASFEVELRVTVQNRMLGGEDNSHSQEQPSQTVRVKFSSRFRLALFTPSGVRYSKRNTLGIQMDHRYRDTSGHDWGPALQRFSTCAVTDSFFAGDETLTALESRLDRV